VPVKLFQSNEELTSPALPYCPVCGKQAVYEKQIYKYSIKDGKPIYQIKALCPGTRSLFWKIKDGEFRLQDDYTWEWYGYDGF